MERKTPVVTIHALQNENQAEVTDKAEGDPSMENRAENRVQVMLSILYPLWASRSFTRSR
jgi:hypothetical protein